MGNKRVPSRPLCPLRAHERPLQCLEQSVGAARLVELLVRSVPFAFDPGPLLNDADRDELGTAEQLDVAQILALLAVLVVLAVRGEAKEASRFTSMSVPIIWSQRKREHIVST